MLTTNESTSAVVLDRLHALLPNGLTEDEARAWLRAPIGGAPLVRRLVEPLLGTGVAEVLVPTAGLGTLVLEELVRLGGFGLELAPVLLAPPTNALSWRADGLPTEPSVGRSEPAPQGGSPARVERVDSAAALRATCARALISETPQRPVVGTRMGELLRARDARLHRSAEILGPCAVGARSTIGRGARLGGGAVVGRGCRVEPGALVEDAVLLDGTHVRAGEHVRCVVRTPFRDLH